MGNDLKGETDPLEDMEKHFAGDVGGVSVPSDELKRVRAHMSKFKKTHRVEGLGFTADDPVDLELAEGMIVLANVFHPPTKTSFFTLKGATFFLAKIYKYVVELHIANPVKARASAFISCICFQLAASAVRSVQEVDVNFSEEQIGQDISTLGFTKEEAANVNDTTFRAGVRVMNTLSKMDTRKDKNFSQAYNKGLNNDAAADQLWGRVIATLADAGWNQEYKDADPVIGVASLLTPLTEIGTRAAKVVNDFFLNDGSQILEFKTEIFNVAETRRNTNYSKQSARVTEFKNGFVDATIKPWVEGLNSLLNQYQSSFSQSKDFNNRINADTFDDSRVGPVEWLEFLESQGPSELPYIILRSHFHTEATEFVDGKSIEALLAYLFNTFPDIKFDEIEEDPTISNSLKTGNTEAVIFRRFTLLEKLLCNLKC